MNCTILFTSVDTISLILIFGQRSPTYQGHPHKPLVHLPLQTQIKKYSKFHGTHISSKKCRYIHRDMPTAKQCLYLTEMSSQRFSIYQKCHHRVFLFNRNVIIQFFYLTECHHIVFLFNRNVIIEFFRFGASSVTRYLNKQVTRFFLSYPKK